MKENKELAKMGLLKVTYFSDQPFDFQDETEDLMDRMGIHKKNIDDENQRYYIADGYIMLDKITRFIKVASYKPFIDNKKRGKNNDIDILGIFFDGDSYDQIVMQQSEFVNYYTIFKQSQLNPFKNLDN